MKYIKNILLTTIICSGLFLLNACTNKEKLNYTNVEDQLTALTEVKAGTSDIAVIDSVMANYYVNKKTFSDLMVVTGEDFIFNSEYYAIGLRKNTNTKDYINYALYLLYQDGTLNSIAEKYGLEDSLCNFISFNDPGEASESSDYYKIKKSGKLVLGYTIFEPIAYMDGNTLTGFDIEVAKSVCLKLGLTLECVKINWDEKENELNSYNIDCIWNGFTYSKEREENLDFSVNYLINKQTIVIRKEDSEKYTTYESMKNAKFTAESGSAGEDVITNTISDKIFK